MINYLILKVNKFFIAIRRRIRWRDARLFLYIWRRQKLSATPDLSGTVLPLCLIPNSALKSAPPFKSVVPKA
ncbi:hypothetical protein, partial [Pseudomonas aeruginosa]|uniref:hypothetical protein n=1 Tax=Pseudomonas aeruginosa TaxID=287 RepID=UPI001C533501